MNRYDSEKEILKIVCGFERCTISREDWRHAEHLTVALYYIWHCDFDTALTKMRGGIFNLLNSFEIDLNIEMPYHETLTIFWLQTVENFKNSANNCEIVEVCNKLIKKFDKDYPLRFYTHDNLFSDKARKQFVEPDK